MVFTATHSPSLRAETVGFCNDSNTPYTEFRFALRTLASAPRGPGDKRPAQHQGQGFQSFGVLGESSQMSSLAMSCLLDSVWSLDAQPLAAHELPGSRGLPMASASMGWLEPPSHQDNSYFDGTIAEPENSNFCHIYKFPSDLFPQGLRLTETLRSSGPQQYQRTFPCSAWHNQFAAVTTSSPLSMPVFSGKARRDAVFYMRRHLLGADQHALDLGFFSISEIERLLV